MKETLKNLDWDDFGSALVMALGGLFLLAVALFLLALYLMLLFTHPFLWLILTVIIVSVVGGAIGLMYLNDKHDWYLF